MPSVKVESTISDLGHGDVGIFSAWFNPMTDSELVFSGTMDGEFVTNVEIRDHDGDGDDECERLVWWGMFPHSAGRLITRANFDDGVNNVIAYKQKHYEQCVAANNASVK